MWAVVPLVWNKRQFYALVTGQADAFYQIFMFLPEVIQKVVDDDGKHLVLHDVVCDQISAMSKESEIINQDLAITMAIYILGFNSYAGFSKKQ